MMVLIWKRENKIWYFIVDFLFFLLKIMFIMLNICEEKCIMSFCLLVNLNICLCEVKKKNSYLCNKILMVVFVWVKEVIVGLF